jgi:hypothetical protein
MVKLANENILDEERAMVIEEQLHEETEPYADLIVATYERAQIELGVAVGWRF